MKTNTKLQDLIELNPIEVGLKILARTLDELIEVPELIYEKIHEDAKVPEKAYEDDACYDIYRVSDPEINPTNILYHTGLRFKIPKGYSIDLYPRSSVSKTNLFLANSVGIVDTGYRGELIINFKLIPSFPEEIIINEDKQLSLFDQTHFNEMYKKIVIPDNLLYKKGDKIGQIRLVKKVKTKLTEGIVDATETERQDKGWGSSGK